MSYKSINKLSETQKAYTAGFLDSDGNIFIDGNSKHYIKNKIQRWALVISFYNCNLDVLNALKKWFGIGSINARDRNPKTWNVSYTLKVRGKSARELLEQVKKYLIVKKEQSKIAIEFGNTFTHESYDGTSWVGGRKLKENIIKKRWELKGRLQSLTLIANYKGKNNV